MHVHIKSAQVTFIFIFHKRIYCKFLSVNILTNYYTSKKIGSNGSVIYGIKCSWMLQDYRIIL